MTKAVWGVRIRLVGALACAVVVSSCGDMTRQGTASSYLVLTSLEGASGTSGTFGSVVQSDVLNVNATTGAMSIAGDQGQASFQLALKDPGTSSSPNTPSPNNLITITQYHVRYLRSDGRNTEGVDVPFAFDGGLTATVSGPTSLVFSLVRIQAKQEAPLKALAFGGGADTITAIAQVTFYGHDQTGRDVSVTGNIQITFSDFAG
jgi:hypothetical protein